MVIIGGIGIPLVADAPLRADERICLGAVTGCIVVYLVAWIIYWCGLSPEMFIGLPILAAFVSLYRRSQMGAIWRDFEARRLLGLWILVAAWCLGWLALVKSYSGGEWIADWLEHYRRTLFFVDRLPLETRFLNLYSLPARPPLANLVLGACLALTNHSFACFQVGITLFSTLAFLPAALLARKFCDRASSDPTPVVALLLMCSPMFVENATFSWTKLPTAFFVLSGLYFYLRNRDDRSLIHPVYVAFPLAAALLTHYSAAPYILVLFGTWLGSGFSLRRKMPSKRIVLAGVAAGLLLATWFGWALWRYGLATVSATTTVSDSVGMNLGEQLARRAMNLFNLIVPHPLRPAEYAYLSQESVLGRWRDYFFNLYQTNLLFAIGTGGIVVLGVLMWRWRKSFDPFWLWFAGALVLLNAAVVSWPDRWGAAHIGYQPLVMVGLAWIASQYSILEPTLRRWLIVGLTLDGMMGIALQFYLQHADLTKVYPDFRDTSLISLRGHATWNNFFTKSAQQLQFLGDLGIPLPAILFSLTTLLTLAIWLSSIPARNKAM